MTVEKVFDELRMGAKDLSSWVIAGSLRNAFRGSVGQASGGCRALIDLGSLPGYRSPSNSEDRIDCINGSETVGAKLHCRKGNSPRPPNKVPKRRSVTKAVESLRQVGCWLRGSHHLNSA